MLPGYIELRIDQQIVSHLHCCMKAICPRLEELHSAAYGNPPLIAEKRVQLAVSERLDLNYAENDPAKADMQERLHIAGMEAMNEYGMAIPTFLVVIKEMDPTARCNVRTIRVTLKDFSSTASLKEDAE